MHYCPRLHIYTYLFEHCIWAFLYPHNHNVVTYFISAESMFVICVSSLLPLYATQVDGWMDACVVSANKRLVMHIAAETGSTVQSFIGLVYFCPSRYYYYYYYFKPSVV